jgi:hypothetical protein
MRLRNVFHRHLERNGYPATIARGDLSCPARVTLGGGANQSITAGQAQRADADTQDIMVEAGAYMPTGSPSLPQTGDVITVTIEQRTTTYIARPKGDNEQCYGESNAEGDQLRVFCVIHERA